MNFYQLYLESQQHDGPSVFFAALEHLHDKTYFYVLCDWLEESGFPAVAHYVRSKVDNVPSYNWGEVRKELSAHGLTLPNYYRYTSFNNAEYRLRNNVIQRRGLNKKGTFVWENIKDNKLIAELIPALAVNLFIAYEDASNYSQTTSHGDQIRAGFLSEKLEELTNVSNDLELGFNSQKDLKYLKSVCDSITQIVHSLENKKLFERTINALIHRLENILDILNDYHITGPIHDTVTQLVTLLRS